MRTLLNKWQPKRGLGKILRFAFWLIAILMGLAFLILPFFKFSGKVLSVVKYFWIACAVLNLDMFGEYRNSRKAKIITPIFTIYTFLLLIYLHNYWQIIPLPVAICGGIVVGLLEFTVSVSIYKTIRFHEKCPCKQLSNKTIHLCVSGCLYACSVALFICGLLTSIAIMFVSGVIAVIFLVVSVLSSISNGLFESKSILKVFWFVLDCMSLIALTIFLIYSIPITFENLQTIVTTIVAAIFGGVLTLAGVAWTIKRSDLIKRQDEIKRAKPIFTFDKVDSHTNERQHKHCIVKSDKAEYRNKLLFLVENSEHATFYLSRLHHDGKWFEIEGNKIVLPNGICHVISEFNDFGSEFLEVQDTLGLIYYYELTVGQDLVEFARNHYLPIVDINEISKNKMENKIAEFLEVKSQQVNN